jgi:hypothetical protein
MKEEENQVLRIKEEDNQGLNTEEGDCPVFEYEGRRESGIENGRR